MQYFSRLSEKYHFMSCAIIPNANIQSVNGEYVQLAKKQIEALGITVLFADVLESQSKQVLNDVDVIYIAGGNTFKLLAEIKKGIGLKTLKKSIQASKATIGVSAGAILLTPTIRIANEIEPDVNDGRLSDFHALDLVNEEFLPHYEDALYDLVESYKSKHNVDVVSSRNGEFIVCDLR